MILKFHYPFKPGSFFADEAINGLVGQHTSIDGCPGKIIIANRCPREYNAMDIVIEIDVAYESYMQFVELFKPNALEEISLNPTEGNHGKKKKRT